MISPVHVEFASSPFIFIPAVSPSRSLPPCVHPHIWQGASYDRVYDVYVLTFWLRSAQERNPEAGSERGWDGSRVPSMDWYINVVDSDSFCPWYEPGSNDDD